jgi:hypothetical protein
MIDPQVSDFIPGERVKWEGRDGTVQPSTDGLWVRVLFDDGYRDGISPRALSRIETGVLTQYRVYLDDGQHDFELDELERATGFAQAAQKFGKLKRFVAREVIEKEIVL